MGSYSELYLSYYPIYSTKNGYFEDVAGLLFLPNDYIEYLRPLKSRNKITWGDAYENDSESETAKVLCSTALICKERLELFGASYDKAKNDYESALSILIEDSYVDFPNLSELSFEHYLSTVRSILNSKGKSHDLNPLYDFHDYLVEHDLMLESQSLSLGLWSMLSVLEPDAQVEYELTDVIDGGWVKLIPQEHLRVKKRIVLTEGKTDSDFLKVGLKLFFPHLEGYYHFMDFEASHIEGSASRLVHTIKSFVGSGIENNIIALFDNDTAGTKEIGNLKKVKLPENIKVLQYPRIELASNYPTIGPSGIQYMDINGLAGSIEMYLGKDCLTDKGLFIPIQWKSYDEKLKRYQGEVLKKDEVQMRFRKKVASFDSHDPQHEHWQELISIIMMLNRAWH